MARILLYDLTNYTEKHALVVYPEEGSKEDK